MVRQYKKWTHGVFFFFFLRNDVSTRKANGTRFNICWKTNVAAAVQQMLNSVSCDVERWNMPFNMLKVVESCWTKIELGSISFNNLPQQVNKSQQCSTFVDEQKLNDVEPCIIRFTLHYPFLVILWFISRQMFLSSKNRKKFLSIFVSSVRGVWRLQISLSVGYTTVQDLGLGMA